ncbi:MAG: DUF255 domain-containing protein [Desulfobacterales bacterium]
MKVDREERPDIDAIYMTAVQALTGGLAYERLDDPGAQTFLRGHLFPGKRRGPGAHMGFLTILQKLVETWHAKDGRIETQANRLPRPSASYMTASPGREPRRKSDATAADFYRQNYDPGFGGLKGAPKFPSSLPVRFLLRYYRGLAMRIFLK